MKKLLYPIVIALVLLGFIGQFWLPLRPMVTVSGIIIILFLILCVIIGVIMVSFAIVEGSQKFYKKWNKKKQL